MKKLKKKKKKTLNSEDKIIVQLYWYPMNISDW